MTRKAFDKIKAGLEDAREIAKGKSMTSMVERIARVIDPDVFADHAAMYAYGIGLGETREQAQRAADGLFGDRVKQAMAKAVAAMLEMREPTDVMLSGLGYVSIRDARMAYADKIRPMIDAEIAAYEAGR
ncbi:hypothetical protein GCM10019059_32410 [Camelimonas fluminis]|uniref:Uncharacterized protein n=1 Tax=Camelimonas fluminis TaxID=1576911 RepID=A0ABV7UHJ5_9HYPH|nr:hypothetical protein [Camelimonas fluminis]GHE70104.1 hypothetical protein GCM10019059_32410 [Camelimonas fluminis]